MESMKRRRRKQGAVGAGRTDLQDLMGHFEVHNRTEGKSPRTVEWYNLALGKLRNWLIEQGEPTALSALNEFRVRRFLLDLQERPGIKGPRMSSHTMYARVNALKSFFGWLNRQGYTEEHRLAALKLPKVSQLVIEPLSAEEITRVLGSMNPHTAMGSRNTALLSLMLDTGLRLSEVTSLKDKDVHIEDRYLKAMGKGSKERVVAFGSSCQKALLQYRYRFRGDPVFFETGEFFLSIDGHALTAPALRCLVKRIAKSSGVTRLHSHLMRHTYATMFLLNGGDVFLLKQNLGHSTLSMVERYVHIASQTAAIRSQGFSPLDRLGPGRERRFSHPSSGGGPAGPRAGMSAKTSGRLRQKR